MKLPLFFLVVSHLNPVRVSIFMLLLTILFFKFRPVDRSKLLGYGTLYHVTLDVPQIYLLLNLNFRRFFLGKHFHSRFLSVFIYKCILLPAVL